MASNNTGFCRLFADIGFDIDGDIYISERNINEMLKRLPDKYADVLKYKYLSNKYSNLTNKEVSRKFNYSYSEARTITDQALRYIRRSSRFKVYFVPPDSDISLNELKTISVNLSNYISTMGNASK